MTAQGSDRRDRGPDINVWRLSLRSSVDIDVLEERERVHAAGLRFKADRDRYVLARAALRHLLGRALGVSGANVPIQAPGRFAKPRLVPDCGWQFSVTHGGDAILIAITECLDVGVDAEPAGERDRPVARLTVHRSERAQLAELAPAARGDWLLRTWVRKEAVAKACGWGLALEFPRLALKADGPAISARYDLGGARWTVQDLAHPRAHFAAVATPGARRPQIIERAWPDLGAWLAPGPAGQPRRAHSSL